jgi:hypothetical protein
MMLRNTRVYSLFILLFIFSCQEEVQKKPVAVEPEWTQMNLESDFQSIEIFQKYDTMIVRTWELKDTTAADGKSYRITTNRKSRIIPIDAKSKDSLYQYVNKMVSEPVITDKHASCYAGSLSVCLQYNNTELCCHYSSVGTWTHISESTKSISRTLSRFTKINNQ